MTAKEVAANLKSGMNLDGAILIAESAVKSLKGGKQEWGVADLPDYRKVADDSHVPESMRKELYKRERDKVKELTKLQNFWGGVLSILRSQKKD